jgi:hypothetical protein
VLALAGEQGAEGGELARARGGRPVLLGEARDIAPHRLGVDLGRREALRAGPQRELLHVDAVGTTRTRAGVSPPQVLLQELDRGAPTRERLFLALQCLPVPFRVR